MTAVDPSVTSGPYTDAQAVVDLAEGHPRARP